MEEQVVEWGHWIESCSICGGPVSFVSNSVIYGTEFGDNPNIYLCDDPTCAAYVGVHAGTDKPLGTMADDNTRRARQMAHSAFDQIWKSGKMKRRAAYEWLAGHLGMSYADCHIGMFDVAQCERVVEIVIKTGVMR